MPKINFKKKKISFSFNEALKLVGYMEQVGGYGGHSTGKTAFQVMEEYEVLDIFSDLRDIVRDEYDD